MHTEVTLRHYRSIRTTLVKKPCTSTAGQDGRGETGTWALPVGGCCSHSGRQRAVPTDTPRTRRPAAPGPQTRNHGTRPSTGTATLTATRPLRAQQWKQTRHHQLVKGKERAVQDPETQLPFRSLSLRRDFPSILSQIQTRSLLGPRPSSKPSLVHVHKSVAT